MADLSEIKVGDKLRLEVKVTAIDSSSVWPVDVTVGDDDDFWPLGWIEAAEHIPAPRVFKRGDWVRWKGDHTKRMVVADKGESLWVTSDDHAKNIIWRKQDCELTEVPE